MGSSKTVISLALLLLAGCQHQASPPEPDELRIALKQYKDEWLKPCKGMADRPGDNTGDLLQDFADAAALGAECKTRHNSSLIYLIPLIEKAKAAD